MDKQTLRLEGVDSVSKVAEIMARILFEYRIIKCGEWYKVEFYCRRTRKREVYLDCVRVQHIPKKKEKK